MNKTIPLKEARAKFSKLVDRVDQLSDRYIVTKNGTPKAVVMSAEEFESWVETLEFMSNPKAVKALEQGLKEAKAGKFHSFKEVFGEDQ
ncbi:MAG: type II toxin-antitoxin system Phd/YefM family antitoxin [Nitrospirota bacterium]